jgi:uncharacterized protein YbjQ (UPF0145 family)
MIVTTTDDIAGYTVTETLGQVYGLVVRSRGIGGNFVASLRSSSYVATCGESSFTLAN